MNRIYNNIIIINAAGFIIPLLQLLLIVPGGEGAG